MNNIYTLIVHDDTETAVDIKERLRKLREFEKTLALVRTSRGGVVAFLKSTACRDDPLTLENAEKLQTAYHEHYEAL